ncbi:MAG: alpha/beta fold hydrolase [Vulcanimicrobiaceae bacterium]
MIAALASRFLGSVLAVLTAFASAAGPQGSDVPIDGIQLHYYESGHGEPLVLLHHFGWSGKVWDPFVSTLAKSFRVIVVDLPGHGGSTGWQEPMYDYDRNAKRVLDLLSAIGVERFDAIGASTGSITLLKMAALQPARVRRMVLVASTTSFSPQTRAWIRKNACAPPSDTDINEQLPYQAHGKEQVLGLTEMFCHEKDNNFVITTDQLKGVTADTLIVHGDRDPIFPLSSAIAEYTVIPNASLWVQPHAGHVFIFKPENRAMFLAIATAFLDGSRK